MAMHEDQKLSEIFARAFVESLSKSQQSRLRDIVLGAAPLSAEDLASLPALYGFVASNADGQHRIANEIRLVLQSVLEREATPHSAVESGVDFNPFIAITKGVEIASTLAPDAACHGTLNVGLFETVLAMKAGDLAKADALMTVLAEQFDIPSLEECTPKNAPELSCVLFMKAIYSDEEISAEAIERLFEVLSSLPKDASLLRAILYNVAVDVFLRQQKMSEAEQAAHRALFHYTAAGERGVAFYVHLYLAVIGLWRGDIDATAARLAEARAALSDFGAGLANDDLLLRSFEMIVLYEQGQPDPLIKHLMSDEETIPFGELWPSIAAPIISFGRRALASKVTPSAALSWVRRWRVKQHRSLRFTRLISLQEAFALQALGRWQEADEVLNGIAGVDDADLLIARFASGFDRNPKSAELGRQIADCLKREDLSVRQKFVLRLLATQSALAREMEREGARHLSAAINEVDPDVRASIWAEQRVRVSEILSKRNLRTELRRFPRMQRQIKTLSEAETTQKPDQLTRQEFRVLQLLAEAQSNKAIGLRLGIALPTVKFHVTNLCRKADVGNRRDVVRSAVAIGWLPKL